MDRERIALKLRLRWVRLSWCKNGTIFWFPKGRKECTLITHNRKKGEAIYHCSPHHLPYHMHKRFRMHSSDIHPVWVWAVQ